ncbi:MAG: class I SAM-dependent methyltransferase [Pseudomonadota bacterium]
MSLSKCRSIGVDPAYHITSSITAPARLFRITSDKFFEDEAQSSRLLRTGIDLSFIDGMHLSEYVLRDFINVEKWCNPEGVIVIDDVLPEQMEMAARDREYNAWCGDVYKLIPALRKYRPDLEVRVFEAFIGPYRKGLAVIKNLDPKNTTLSEKYDEISAGMIGHAYNVDSIKALEDLVQVTWDIDFEAYIASLSAPKRSITGIIKPAEAMVTSEA